MCLYPQLIQNRKYIPNKKNGGIVPVLHDKRAMAVPIGCGQCMECRKQKARDWQIRLLEDIRKNKNGKMITLTFSNESIKKLKEEITDKIGYELDNQIATIAVHRFRERWRKEFGKTIRHWLITELGGGRYEHLHIHGIVWTDEKKEIIEKHWKYGTIWQGTFVNEKTINYNIKYVHKIDIKHKEYKPKILTSPGIGANYLNREDSKGNKYKGTETKEYYVTRTGHKVALPKYFRNKIYKDEEREKLWMEMLNKEERYIDKNKVSIKDGEEQYYELLKQARLKNKKLGYGNDEKNWKQKEYEQQRRQWLINKRIEEANAQERLIDPINTAV